MSVACEQVKRKIGKPGERSAVWGEEERKPFFLSLLSELDFCLRPRPHLGACSQAMSGVSRARNIVSLIFLARAFARQLL